MTFDQPSDRPSDSPAGNRSETDPTTRRRALALAGAVGAAGLAGCTALDVVTGDPAEFASGTATVADATLSESGYQLNEVTENTQTREFDVAGSTREVRVTSRIAEYDKAVELLGERYQAAVFAVLATPRVEVLGQAFNPVGELDDEERAQLIVDRYEGVSSLERGSEYTTDVLSTEASVVVYSGEGEIEGTGVSVELEFHVAEAVEAGSDYVVPLAAYPASFGDGENVRRMLNGIEHEPASEDD
ncbi:DUF6517 family protein [Halorubrum kocurii]|uniref:Uncharacterized protein n=1 Tax=Halorubrum kocurii JCM 14978 TaxID=1230456 RepID=M0NWM6_9EURY|nr:DUF6517 family protein [Halorubrum kocurii]EMA62357.1 hypothetical protein C468_11167 [Halorubrum kocurii JCM 14978]